MGLRRSWLSHKVAVGRSRIHGKGLFASEPVAIGERIAVLGGDIMLIEEIERLPRRMQHYPMQIEERFVLGDRTATEPEDTDLFNHSCEPNIGFRGQIFLVALTEINKGEEVTFDYAMVVSESIDSDIKFEMECRCRFPGCRNTITEDDWKLPELQRRYDGYFSQYLQERIDTLRKRKP